MSEGDPKSDDSGDMSIDEDLFDTEYKPGEEDKSESDEEDSNDEKGPKEEKKAKNKKKGGRQGEESEKVGSGKGNQLGKPDSNAPKAKKSMETPSTSHNFEDEFDDFNFSHENLADGDNRFGDFAEEGDPGEDDGNDGKGQEEEKAKKKRKAGQQGEESGKVGSGKGNQFENEDANAAKAKKSKETPSTSRPIEDEFPDFSQENLADGGNPFGDLPEEGEPAEDDGNEADTEGGDWREALLEKSLDFQEARKLNQRTNFSLTTTVKRLVESLEVGAEFVVSRGKVCFMSSLLNTSRINKLKKLCFGFRVKNLYVQLESGAN